MKLWYYGKSFPSSSKSGLDEADNSTICVEVGEKRKKRKPQSNDEIDIKSQNMLMIVDQIKQDISNLILET